MTKPRKSEKRLDLEFLPSVFAFLIFSLFKHFKVKNVYMTGAGE